VIARPIAHHPPFGAREERRIPHDELPVETAFDRTWDGETAQTSADVLEDLQHVNGAWVIPR
jgi:hypothetical protein